MASYKERVAGDIDRWIEAGLAPAQSRAAMLASIPDARRMDAAQTLAWVGAILAGIALIAFIGANWEALPRLAKFVAVLAVFAGAAGGAAWCAGHKRPNAANGLLTFAALAFAAAVGLTGEIFDIGGDERTALYAAGAVAAALALAGRASGPAVVALFFVAAADFAVPGVFDGGAGPTFAWLFLAAPAAAALALRWRSTALAHAAALALIAAALWLAVRIEANAWERLAIAVALGALAGGARWLRERGETRAGVFYGWLAWAAVGFFIVCGFGHGEALAIIHRLAWLALGAALVTLGRHDRQGAVTAAGVLSLMGAVSVLMYDLGLGLMMASAVFFCAAILAGLAGLVLAPEGGAMTPPAPPLRILAVAGAAILALVGLVVHESVARADGTEVVMAMQTIDPQGLLTGDFVAITLNEALRVGQACPPGSTTGALPNTGLGVRPLQWVALSPRGGAWSVVGVAPTRAAAARMAPLTAQGDAYCVPAYAPSSPGSVATDLGVDRISLSQTEAARVAQIVGQPAGTGGVFALLSIGADGQARVKGLMVQGKRLELSWY